MPNNFEEYAFYSYECKPLPTNYCTAAEVLEFRDKAWHKYFSNPNYLNLIKKKFGIQNMENIKKLSKIKLKRKIISK